MQTKQKKQPPASQVLLYGAAVHVVPLQPPPTVTLNFYRHFQFRKQCQLLFLLASLLFNERTAADCSLVWHDAAPLESAQK